METIRTTELPSLIVDLEAARVRLSYIASFSAITDEYMALNNIAFTWPQRIIPILEDHERIVSASKGNCQEVLKERREKFDAELDDFSKQVDDLQEVGDLDEMPFYVKKVQSLHKQLQTAAETSAAFNREESLYGWEHTVYPARKQIMDALEPYQLLYSNAVTFQKSYKRWMDGNLLELEAEQVEQDVDSIKKEMHRVLILLPPAAAPRKVASQVMERLDEFMLNMPLIRVLCNPGMRDRHWDRLSEIAGMEIKPDASTTLRKMLKLQLEPYLDEFQEIGGEFKHFSDVLR
jgi:dynein heavy chain